MKLLTLFRIFLVLCGILTYSSCCNEQDENSGAILGDFYITNYRGYDHNSCFTIPETLCIRDDSTYRNAFKIKSAPADCQELVLPPIDFSKVSLLIYQKSEGSRAFFHRKVTFNPVNKTVTYTISIERCGCMDKCASESYNMVIVPSIEDGYTIIYN